MTTTNLPSPSDLLGSGDFDDWYPGQYDLLQQSLEWYDSPSRFLGLSVPTGSGKSLNALLLSRLSEARTVVLTATKGLQDQYLRSYYGQGMVLVKGQNNFPCILARGLMADEGPCHEGLPCEVRKQCPYRVQVDKALQSRLIITNYAYWLAQTNFSQGLGDVGLLILDEGHLAFSAMENYLTIYISRLDVQPLGLSFPSNADNWGAWKTWAVVAAPVVEDEVSRLDEDTKEYRGDGGTVPTSLSRAYRSANRVLFGLQRLAQADEQWVIQRTKHGYRFVPKWVSGYVRHLIHTVPKVVLMSAILSHRTLDYIGIPRGDDRTWIETDSSFPASNTPVWHIPTARINYRTDDYGATIWCSRIDQIIQRRQDRKGIVFTVSYERARMLLSRSRYRDIMYTHGTGDVVQVVGKFKNAPAPAVLVSPTVTTGWDFPGLDYIVQGKIPYPDTKDPVTKARHEDDKEWTSYMAMENFVQSSGRGTRSATDKCEVLVVDDNFRWWWYRYRDFAPRWFRDRVRGSLEVVPEPLV